jgi:chemotaxis protein histidine kinase CheA
MHTVKGNARLLGLGRIVDVVHDAEGAHAELRRGDGPADRSRLLGVLDSVSGAIREYEETCRQKLALKSGEPDEKLERGLRQIEQLLGDSGKDPAAIMERAREVMRAVRAVSLRELVKETSRIVPSLARELDKSVPEIECDPDETLLCAEWAEVLRDVFVQSFRNSLAHGIESREEREATGKHGRGRIRLRTEHDHAGFCVRVSDDGKGLPLDLLRERVGAGSVDDDDLVETVFSAGVSTASDVSPTAGRGVGMDLVRSSVRRHGGDVGIVFTGEKKAGRRPFELIVKLPPDAVVEHGGAAKAAERQVEASTVR